MISCATCERSVACGVGAVPGACSTCSAGSATPSKCTLPLLVWRWPKASQSGCTATPAAPVGSTPIKAACDASCQADTVSQSEPTEPDEKLLMPLSVNPRSEEHTSE